MLKQGSEELLGEITERENKISNNAFHQANRELIASVVKGINNGQGRILEIGCGHGDITKNYISPNCANVIATDYTKRFVDHKISSNIKFLVMDALNISFPDNTFDGIISIEVIEHIENDIGFIRESLRVLREGGALLFTTPNRLRLTSLLRYLIGKPIKFPHNYATDPVLGDILHLREYSYRDLCNLLKSFSVQSIEIKGVWFGIPHFQLGILHPPKLFEKLAFNWHVKIIK